MSKEEFYKKVLDSVPFSVVLLNKDGEIVFVNKVWRDFGDVNHLTMKNYALGENYIKICEKAEGKDAEDAKIIATKLKSIITGETEEIEFEYPCHSPIEKRWFMMIAKKFEYEEGFTVLMIHHNITERKLAELELQNKMVEIQKLNSLMEDREIKMINLKEELRSLKDSKK